MAQSVERPTLDFGSGRDLTVCESEPHVGICADSEEPAWDSLSPSLSAPLLLVFSLSLSLCPSPRCTIYLKINKLKKNRIDKLQNNIKFVSALKKENVVIAQSGWIWTGGNWGQV